MNSKNGTMVTSNDRAIEYKSMVYKVKHMISEIKDMGFDTSKLESRLQKIINDVEEKSLSSSRKEIMKEGFLTTDYLKATEELRSFEILLAPYKIYYEAINTCKYVLSKINSDNSLQEIKYYANLVIMALKKIRTSNTMYFQDEEDVVKGVYEIAYNVIKMEIMITGSSDIYEYAKDNDIDLYFLDKYLKEDLKTINLDDPKYSNIKTKLYNAKRNGLDKGYFDIELIKMIVLYGDDTFKNNMVKRLNELEKEIYDNLEKLISELDSFDKLNDEYKEYKNTIKGYRKDASKKLISFLLVVSLVLGGGYGVFRLCKNGSTKKICDVKTTVYSEETGLIDTSTEKDTIDGIFEVSYYDEVTVTVYGPWEERMILKPVRNETQYNLSDINLETIYDYLEYDLSDEEPSSSRTISYNEEEKDRYSEEFKEVEIKENIDLGQETLNKGTFALLLTLMGGLYAVVLLVAICIFASCDMHFGNLISGIREDLKSINNSKWLTLEKEIELKKKLKKLLDIIMMDEELRMKFNKLFEENKYLLNNPEELLERINKNEFGQAKEKVRKLVKDSEIK